MRAARTAKGLTQQTLAERANTSVGVVSAIECGRYTPGLDLACRLANVMGASLDVLAGRVDEQALAPSAAPSVAA